MMRQEVHFHIQTITPLFMAGADQKLIAIPERKQRDKKGNTAAEAGDLQPEIRSPSFRGVMRYWLRAAIGGLLDTTELYLEDITLFEKKIFGSINLGSALQVRVTEIQGKPQRFRLERLSKGRNASRVSVYGSDYLLFSMAENGYAANYKPDRYYFPATRDQTRFKLVLSEHAQNTDTQQTEVPPQASYTSKLQCGMAALWLLTQLGGVGSRSHRCAGSLSVQEVTGIETQLPFVEASDPEALRKQLQQGLHEVRRIISHYHTHLTKVENGQRLTGATFDCLALPRYCRIWILVGNNKEPWDSNEKAMDDIGVKLSEYRSKQNLLSRATFGLPIVTSNSNDWQLQSVLGKYRRSSPLHLRITRLENNMYVGVAVLFKTSMTSIIDEKYERTIPSPDYALIENWINTDFPDALEVSL